MSDLHKPIAWGVPALATGVIAQCRTGRVHGLEPNAHPQALKFASRSGRASAVREVGLTLSDLDDVAIRVADIAARLAVLILRLGDELGAPTFP